MSENIEEKQIPDPEEEDSGDDDDLGKYMIDDDDDLPPPVSKNNCSARKNSAITWLQVSLVSKSIVVTNCLSTETSGR